MIIAWFQEEPAQVAKSKISQSLTVVKDMWDCFCFMVTPSTIGAAYLPQLEEVSPKWQCPANSPVTCFIWNLLSFKSSVVLLAEGPSKKPFACLCPKMDCQYLWCSLQTQSVMTYLATLPKIPQAVLGPVNGYREPILASCSAVSLPSIPLCPGTHIRYTLLRTASVIRDWWQSQTNLE
jgi:hypothetical protein